MEIKASDRFSPTALDKQKQEVDSDPVMQRLHYAIDHGWSNYQKDVPSKLVQYYSVRHELYIEDNLVMKGDTIVVPKSLQAEYVRKLHNGRLDAESCKRRAREILFWPRMSKDIENFVKMCAVCNSCKSHLQKEPLMMHDMPSRPWSIVATDLFQWNGNNYLVTVDSYSGWYEIDLLGSNSSIAVIKKLKNHFPRYGIPDELYSDNGPQYSPYEFKMFVEEWNFCHLTSSPEYAQSNGLAEMLSKQQRP